MRVSRVRCGTICYKGLIISLQKGGGAIKIKKVNVCLAFALEYLIRKIVRNFADSSSVDVECIKIFHVDSVFCSFNDRFIDLLPLTGKRALKHDRHFFGSGIINSIGVATIGLALVVDNRDAS